MNDLPELTLDREFDAPRELVWRAWTDPQLVAHWYGPNVETTIHKFELKKGGIWLNEMKMGGGSKFEKMIFQEVEEPSKLSWHHHSSVDADGNDTAPMMPNWPPILLTSVLFEENGKKTKVKFTQVPFEASDAEIASFAKMIEGMSSGWGKGFAMIDDLLAEMQAGR